MVDAIETRLADNMWLGGQQPSKEDAEQAAALGSAPNVDTHPNAFAWFTLVSRFTDAVKGTWPAAAAGGADAVSNFLATQPLRPLPAHWSGTVTQPREKPIGCGRGNAC